MQTKLGSFIEANVNTFIGFAGSWLLMYFLIPHMFPDYVGHSAANSFYVVCIFTWWSVVRGYFVRRYFNRANKAYKRVTADEFRKMMLEYREAIYNAAEADQLEDIQQKHVEVNSVYRRMAKRVVEGK
jgi:hypothetical protein